MLLLMALPILVGCSKEEEEPKYAWSESELIGQWQRVTDNNWVYVINFMSNGTLEIYSGDQTLYGSYGHVSGSGDIMLNNIKTM